MGTPKHAHVVLGGNIHKRLLFTAGWEHQKFVIYCWMGKQKRAHLLLGEYTKSWVCSREWEHQKVPFYCWMGTRTHAHFTPLGGKVNMHI